MNKPIPEINSTIHSLNRKLHEAMGKCWHEFNNDCVCQKPGCSADNSFRNANPDYLNSLPDAFELVEWMRKEKRWEVVISTGTGVYWDVEISQDDNGAPVASAFDESLPTAISLACAEALGIEAAQITEK